MNVLNKAKLRGKFEIKVTDGDGNKVKVFQPNFIVKKLIREGLIHPKFHMRDWMKYVGFLFGRMSDSLIVDNLIPTAGKAGAAGRLNGFGSEAAFTYLEVGTGTTAAAAGDTALETPIVDSGLARASATVSLVTTSTTDDTAQLLKSWSVTGAKAITELGALNAASAGILLGRQVFSAINVLDGWTLELTYKFQVS